MFTDWTQVDSAEKALDAHDARLQHDAANLAQVYLFKRGDDPVRAAFDLHMTWRPLPRTEYEDAVQDAAVAMLCARMDEAQRTVFAIATQPYDGRVGDVVAAAKALALHDAWRNELADWATRLRSAA